MYGSEHNFLRSDVLKDANGKHDVPSHRIRRSIDRVERQKRAFPDNFTMEGLIQGAGQQVSQLFSFLNRDLVAKAILNLDQLYGNSSTILVVANQVLGLASMLMSNLPFGGLLPLMMQAGIAVFLASPTRFLIKFLLFRLWEILPARAGDQYTVSMDKMNIIVHGQNGETNEIIAQTAAPQLFGNGIFGRK